MLDKNPFMIDEFKGLHLGSADNVAPIECQDCVPFSYAVEAKNIYFLKDGGIETRGPFLTLKAIPDPEFEITFIATPVEGGLVGEGTVEFDSSIVVPGTEPYTYDWDFGDGSLHGAVEDPIHVYEQGGGANPQTFTVLLTVTDDTGAIATYSLDVEVPFTL